MVAHAPEELDPRPGTPAPEPPACHIEPMPAPAPEPETAPTSAPAPEPETEPIPEMYYELASELEVCQRELRGPGGLFHPHRPHHHHHGPHGPHGHCGPHGHHGHCGPDGRPCPPPPVGPDGRPVPPPPHGPEGPEGPEPRGPHPMDRIDRGTLAVLRYLADHDGQATPSEIAMALRLSNPRISNALAALERDGRITRAHDEADRRKVVVRITEEGTEHITALARRHQAELAGFLEEMGEDDARELVRLLKRAAAITSERRDRAIDREVDDLMGPAERPEG